MQKYAHIHMHPKDYCKFHLAICLNTYALDENILSSRIHDSYKRLESLVFFVFWNNYVMLQGLKKKPVIISCCLFFLLSPWNKMFRVLTSYFYLQVWEQAALNVGRIYCSKKKMGENQSNVSGKK